MKVWSLENRYEQIFELPSFRASEFWKIFSYSISNFEISNRDFRKIGNSKVEFSNLEISHFREI
jgi:hypothetical protein